MKFSKEELIILKNLRQSGDVSAIQKRLEKKGLTFNERYVRAVLDPKDEKYNEDIIEEAILYEEDKKKKSHEMKRRISALNDCYEEE